MKNTFIALGIAALFLFGSCGKEADEETNETGTLSVNMTMWNTYKSGDGGTPAGTGTDPVTLDIIDLKSFKMDLKVTTGKIQEGVPDDFEWISIYESDETLLNSQRDFQFQLPAGHYRGIGLLQGNRFHWVCRNGDQVMELEDYNNPGAAPETHVYNIFGEDGLYVPDEGNLLVKVMNNEKLGTFEIKPGKKTLVTIRMNTMTLEWFDNDNDGKWSSGDHIDNWKLPEGITTMADFLVEYQ